MTKLPKSLTTVTRVSKTIALIMFIALPFIGFYLGMKYQQEMTPQVQIYNPTANWKTSNLPSFLNFSFKYPNDWSETFDTQVTLTKGNYNWLIAISDNSQHMSLRDFVTSAPFANLHAGSRRLTVSQFDSAQKIFVNTIPAIKLDTYISYAPNPGGENLEEIFFVQGNSEFYISYPLKDNTNSESVTNYNTVQQIISTFKFTN